MTHLTQRLSTQCLTTQCPECKTKIDEYYNVCRPCYSKYKRPLTFDDYDEICKEADLSIYRVINPPADTCIFDIYNQIECIQHWYQCKNCDIEFSTGRCLACAQSCIKAGHILKVRYGPYRCEEGYRKAVIKLRNEKAQKRKENKCVIA